MTRHYRIAGVDEAGRGPLAGPVVAAAVILDPTRPIAGLADSKKLSVRQRETLAEQIMANALAVGVGVIEAGEIDRINILQATMRAMVVAVNALKIVPELVRVDGNRAPPMNLPVQTIVGGDGTDRAIGAASIIAKTRRDAIMVEMDRQYPEYNFARHKGYPTAAHLAALEQHGPCPIHRLSFRPVRQSELF